MADGEQELQAIVRAVLRPMFRSIWRIRVSGVENIPATGGAILTPNHTSVIDSFFLPAAAPRPVSFVGKAEYLDDWKTRKLFPALGMIPIDRSGGDASQRALDTAARVLEGGDLLRFTRRAPGLEPASFTRGTRALLVCRSAPAVRSSRWASRVLGRSNRPTNRCPTSFVPWRSTSARRSIRPRRIR